MRDLVTIERNTPTQGDQGELIDNWAATETAWAYIRGVAGSEQENNYQIRIRFRAILHTDRIVFGSRIFNITSVVDKDGQGRDLLLEARELV